MARQGVEPVEVTKDQIDEAFGGGTRGSPAAAQTTGMVRPMEHFQLPSLAPERDELKVLDKLIKLAAAAGDDWFYRFPVNRNVKDPETGKWVKVREYIEGPSIKCANNVARIYGNCLVDCRLGQETPDAWVFYAMFADRETGFTMVRAFKQRKRQNIGMGDEGRAEDIVFQIGQSKAIRNIIDNALEQFTSRAFDEAKKSIVNRIAGKMDETRAWIRAELAKLKPAVAVERVERVRLRKIDQWTSADMALIYAELQAIHDGWTIADDCWPREEPTDEAVAKTASDPATVSKQNQELETAGAEFEKAKAAAAAKAKSEAEAAEARANAERKAAAEKAEAEQAEIAQAEADRKAADEKAKAEADAQARELEEQERKRIEEEEAAAKAAAEKAAAADADKEGNGKPKRNKKAEKPEPVSPTVLKYQGPPVEWIKKTVGPMIDKMSSVDDLDRLLQINDQLLKFVERTSRPATDNLAAWIKKRRAELAAAG